MKYMDVKSASEKWGITPRRVRILCNDGRIDGAVRNGWSWVIPASTPKPGDGRVLRRFKALDIRPGTVDVDTLKDLKRLHTVSEYFSSPSLKRRVALTLSSLFALSGESVTEDEIERILSGFLVYNLSLKIHILTVNFFSLLKEESKRDVKLGEGELKRLYVSLLRGVEETDGSYEKGYVMRGGEKVERGDAIEITLTQYETMWSQMHALSSSLLLTGEMMRVAPYKDYSPLFFYLVFSSSLMRGGFIPPTIMPSSLDEAKAAYALVSSRGVYTDMTAFMERMLVKTYGEIEKDV